jgi:hypothetical protein
MNDDANPEPLGWGVFVSLFVVLFRFVFIFPYSGLASFAAVALSGRDRFVAYGYATLLQWEGEPFPDPLPPAEEMRRRFLDRLPNPDGLVREQDVFAGEQWLVVSTRVVCFATLAAAVAVLAGAGFAAWRYGLPWAEMRVAAAPWSGVPLVAAATAGVWTVAGWLAAGAFVLTARWGPVRWFADWSVARANRELWAGSPPQEVTHGADPP